MTRIPTLMFLVFWVVSACAPVPQGVETTVPAPPKDQAESVDVQLPEDETGDTDDQTENLETDPCEDKVCGERETCDEDSGVCVSVYPGECDPIAQDCGGGKGCYVGRTIDDPTTTTLCYSHKGKTDGQSCEYLNDCAPGFECVNINGGSYHCRKMCDPEASQNTCANGDTCSTWDALPHLGTCPVSQCIEDTDCPNGYKCGSFDQGRMCAAVCDPLLQNCASGKCAFLHEICITAGSGTSGASCSGDSDCAAGYWCGWGTKCAKICDLSDNDPGCGVNTCNQVSESYDAGYCFE